MDEDLEFDFGDVEETPTTPEAPALRLSVSALRDYRRCPRYYKFKRIDKKKEVMTHHAPAGNLVHSSFYMAYGYPVIASNPTTGRTKLEWRVSGDFDPKNGPAMLKALWYRDPMGSEEIEGQIYDELPPHLHNAYALLADDLEHVNNFKPGQKKALKSPDQAVLRDAWFEEFKAMLESSLEKPLSYPVMQIERMRRFVLGGIDMVAFYDLTLDSSRVHGTDGTTTVDLKSGQTKPSEAELYFDDQVQTYYSGDDPNDFWLYHLKSGEIFAIERNEPLIASLNEMAEQDALSIQAGFFPKRYDKQICSRCPFRKECHGS